MQPIGLVDNRDDFRAMFDLWREGIGADHPEAGDADWEGCWSNLFGGDDLLWSVPDAALGPSRRRSSCCSGDDLFHPHQASEQLAAAAPNATLVERWREPADVPAARAAVEQFLAQHAAP